MYFRVLKCKLGELYSPVSSCTCFKVKRELYSPVSSCTCFKVKRIVQSSLILYLFQINVFLKESYIRKSVCHFAFPPICYFSNTVFFSIRIRVCYYSPFGLTHSSVATINPANAHTISISPTASGNIMK